MNEETAIKICKQMTDNIESLCECCRKNEKDKTCIGCRELAIRTILKQNKELKKENEGYKKLGFKYLNTQNKKLQNNWNDLKEFVGKRLYYLNGFLKRDLDEQGMLNAYASVMAEIQDLECGSNE